MTNPTPTSVGSRVSDAAEEALKATTQALDSSRQFASEAAGKIGETARDLRQGAVEIARTGAASVSDATVAAQRQLGRLAGATRRQVTEAPLKTVLVAAAAGAAVALVLSMFRNRRDTD